MTDAGQSLYLCTLSATKCRVGVNLDALSWQDDGAGCHIVPNHQCTVHRKVAVAYPNSTPGNLIRQKSSSLLVRRIKEERY